ncbi:succinoglycan biosynthesis protein ExoM [Mesorhizobium soli]|uniref:glycosyltransferase n=1 Tax=Pseudaminobacter soli (ex Li et al. 2025) TaxID=1295366 RepID=UPI002476695F|nr:glycosyltransferase [Mesorhizobium soli]MDH6230355.1 succinoglycan biosynthesis protein ExoM [Mesorhizobium soli]
MNAPRSQRSKPRRVDIGVCTFRRAELEYTLRSLAALSVPANTVLRVIVADNDVEPSARSLVYALAGELPFEIAYVHCPAANISLARNTCLESGGGDFLAFIDDDSTASPEWLAELLKIADATGADAVLGPVQAVYEAGAPDWMSQGDFHSTKPVFVNGEIHTGYSGNVLLRRTSPRLAGRRFNLARGRSGGEDTEYFARLHQAGGRIAFAPSALVVEPVPAERTELSWLIKRRFRAGQTHGRLLTELKPNRAAWPQVGVAAAKAAYCFAAAAANAIFADRRNRFALRGVMHVGAVSGLLGAQEIKQYGERQTAGKRGNAA